LNKKYLPILNKRFPKSLQNCLNDFKKSWEDLDKLSKLNKNWEKLIGLELSRECKPLKIEQKILTIAVNHPQWRQALIYNKHTLKETITRFGINLNEIKIIQNYEVKILDRKYTNAKIIWESRPSRIKNNNIVTCKSCNNPAPKGEISRWGKCTFCWRKNI
tara:strand:+ start:1745 stop:2227 length:483 start_codon:yes stop_codon:yes gene_type:complete